LVLGHRCKIHRLFFYFLENLAALGAGSAGDALALVNGGGFKALLLDGPYRAYGKTGTMVVLGTEFGFGYYHDVDSFFRLLESLIRTQMTADIEDPFLPRLVHLIRQLPETLHFEAVPVTTPRTIWAPKAASANRDRAISRYLRNLSNGIYPQLQPPPEQQDPPPRSEDESGPSATLAAKVESSFSVLPLHLGHSGCGAQQELESSSNWWLHFVQRYSYIGMVTPFCFLYRCLCPAIYKSRKNPARL
jgi:hypothetical protein